MRKHFCFGAIFSLVHSLRLVTRKHVSLPRISILPKYGSRSAGVFPLRVASDTAAEYAATNERIPDIRPLDVLHEISTSIDKFT